MKSNMIQKLRIQDFPEGAPTTKVGVLTYNFVNLFEENCMKNERIFIVCEMYTTEKVPTHYLVICFLIKGLK